MQKQLHMKQPCRNSKTILHIVFLNEYAGKCVVHYYRENIQRDWKLSLMFL